jgi:hypothetical protein
MTMPSFTKLATLKRGINPGNAALRHPKLFRGWPAFEE